MSDDVAFEGQITLSGEPGTRLSLLSAVRRLVVFLIGVCIAIGISLESLAGQTLRGRILDSETRDPVRLAYVGLLTEGESMAVATLADTAGFFEITAPDPGPYFVYISRSGYETIMDGVFELGYKAELDVRIGMKPLPIELDEVLVEIERGTADFLERNGFYERAITGRGVLMLREDIERFAINRVSDVMRRIPLLDIDDSRPLAGPESFRNPEIRVVRNGQYCSPTLYIDRNLVNSGSLGSVRPDDYVSVVEIDAIEVYARSSEVPVGFDEINNCGVILIWTRTR
ncbi:MAG: hypothetical protein CME27_09330 [Gemmatimonadetes bacterium]|nr:hypothetical protein [Gemmatimonadota bacterium]|tara:strand:+ start:6353 stop:7210 length:858 start_codon:yes stop_codon:yes gene_type:complete